MKTLDQVEPRTPIPGGNVAPTISASGSYYLSGNLYRTLTISASNVTLDLMGFTIDPSSGGAIMIGSSLKNLTVRNGILTGAEIGIDARSLRESNSRFEKLTVSACSDIGLYIGSGCIVEDCVVNACGNYGIFSSNDGKLEVRNCRITGTTLNGVVSAGGSRIIGNTIEGSGANGLRLIGTNSYVIGNIVIGNVDNYDFAQGNQLNLLLGEIPEALDWPCSVKFAGTLNTTQTGTNGITVTADDVTIDMAGHALVGPGANSGSGIYQAGHYRNLRVFNGKVVEWRGDGTGGVFVFGSSVHLSDMQVTTNNSGIVAGGNSTLSECASLHNTGDGIQITQNSRIVGCICSNNGFSFADNSAGIHATLSKNRIEGNTCTGSDRGIDVDSVGNFIARNTCSNNALNWDVVAGNVCLVVNATTAGAISGNSGGAAPGSTDPNANFTY